jgi:hypothetical protein
LFFPHDLNFAIQCTDFRLQTYTDGSPLSYESDLVVIDKKSAAVLAKQTIRVNEPLKYDGYTFYQSSYQVVSEDAKVRLALAFHNKPRQLYTVSLGQKLEMPDGTQIIPLKVLDDYEGLGLPCRCNKSVQMQKVLALPYFANIPTLIKGCDEAPSMFGFRGLIINMPPV